MKSLVLAASSAAVLSWVSSAALASFSYGVISYEDVADTFSPSPFRQFTPPAINNASEVAFAALLQRPVLALYRAPAGVGPLVPIADTTLTYNDLSSPTLNNQGLVTFRGNTYANTPPGSNQTIVTGSGGALTTVSAFAPGTAWTNDGGATVYHGYSGGGYPQIKVDNGGVVTPSSRPIRPDRAHHRIQTPPDAARIPS